MFSHERNLDNKQVAGLCSWREKKTEDEIRKDCMALPGIYESYVVLYSQRKGKLEK